MFRVQDVEDFILRQECNYPGFDTEVLGRKDYGLYVGKVNKEYCFTQEFNSLREYTSSHLSYFLCKLLCSWRSFIE